MPEPESEEQFGKYPEYYIVHGDMNHIYDGQGSAWTWPPELRGDKRFVQVTSFDENVEDREVFVSTDGTFPYVKLNAGAYIKTEWPPEAYAWAAEGKAWPKLPEFPKRENIVLANKTFNALVLTQILIGATRKCLDSSNQMQDHFVRHNGKTDVWGAELPERRRLVAEGYKKIKIDEGAPNLKKILNMDGNPAELKQIARLYNCALEAALYQYYAAGNCSGNKLLFAMFAKYAPPGYTISLMQHTSSKHNFLVISPPGEGTIDRKIFADFWPTNAQALLVKDCALRNSLEKGRCLLLCKHSITEENAGTDLIANALSVVPLDRIKALPSTDLIAKDGDGHLALDSYSRMSNSKTYDPLFREYYGNDHTGVLQKLSSFDLAYVEETKKNNESDTRLNERPFETECSEKFGKDQTWRYSVNEDGRRWYNEKLAALIDSIGYKTKDPARSTDAIGLPQHLMPFAQGTMFRPVTKKSHAFFLTDGHTISPPDLDASKSDAFNIKDIYFHQADSPTNRPTVKFHMRHTQTNTPNSNECIITSTVTKCDVEKIYTLSTKLNDALPEKFLKHSGKKPASLGGAATFELESCGESLPWMLRRTEEGVLYLEASYGDMRNHKNSRLDMDSKEVRPEVVSAPQLPMPLASRPQQELLTSTRRSNENGQAPLPEETPSRRSARLQSALEYARGAAKKPFRALKKAKNLFKGGSQRGGGTGGHDR